MFCSKCGNEVMDEAVICPKCGCPTGNKATNDEVEDYPSIGLNILGFLIPFAGLIMFCVMHGKTPNKARQIGLWSLAGFILNFVIWLFL